MEEEQKNRYVLGTIGALIGAFVGAIPWILMYVYGNTIYALLSILIVVGSFYGYKLTKAKIDKKLPVILSITSFISITVTTLVIIPIIYMVYMRSLRILWSVFTVSVPYLFYAAHQLACVSIYLDQ